MCLVQEPPALHSPAEGTLAPLDQMPVAPSSTSCLPFVISRSRGPCHHPSASRVLVGSQPPPIWSYFWVSDFLRTKTNKNNEQKQNIFKNLLKKPIKIKNFQRITIYFINLRIYYINIYPSSLISLPPLSLVMKT